MISPPAASVLIHSTMQIKPTFFHVEPLDETQLENWRRYLEAEESFGNHHRIIHLYERCIIPLANYTEFWVRYSRYLESQGKIDQARTLFQRLTDTFQKRRFFFRPVLVIPCDRLLLHYCTTDRRHSEPFRFPTHRLCSCHSSLLFVFSLAHFCCVSLTNQACIRIDPNQWPGSSYPTLWLTAPLDR